MTVAGGSVDVEKGFRPAGEIAEADVMTGTGTGGPVVAGTRFLAVAEVYDPMEGTEGDGQSDIRKFAKNTEVITEMTSPHQLEHTRARGETAVSVDTRGKSNSENGAHFMDPDGIRRTSDTEKVVFSPMDSSKKVIDTVDTDSTEGPEEGDTIMVGVVGSAAPWFLTGWTNDVEVEFMIDTGCQVTILATSVFDRMCDIHPKVRNGLQRLVSADSSPLTVMGRISLNVVFPGLRCDMWCVVAGIGTDGLLGTEALQLCLPHQLDLRTGQLWADGRSTLQLHQQKSTPSVSGSLITAVVLPPDSEVVAVGHTLVDATTPSASVLIINPNAEEVVLPCGSNIGDLVPVLSVSVARSTEYLQDTMTVELPEYLEDIVRESHASLGDSGRQSLQSLLYKYKHVFPAPEEPVTGRSKSVQHEIEIKDARPVRCGPRRLAPAGLRREQDCVREMLSGGQIEPSDSPWASPVLLVMKKDGSTRFCVDYRRLNSLTVKDAYPLPRIDDSLRLLGNQQWFSTMDLASGYWQVAMSPEARNQLSVITDMGSSTTDTNRQTLHVYIAKHGRLCLPLIWAFKHM